MHHLARLASAQSLKPRYEKAPFSETIRKEQIHENSSLAPLPFYYVLRFEEAGAFVPFKFIEVAYRFLLS
jgi:hypothetical protein